MKLRDLGEGAFLERVRSWTATSNPELLLGVGDDAALLRTAASEDIVVSTDAFLEGVHFTRTSFSPEDIGHKAMAASLSDLAAMGARGSAAFVNLFTPADTDVEFLERMYRGMRRAADPWGVAIAGGDCVVGPLALGITVVGFAPHGEAIRRSGARPGDVIFVSGELGGSEAGRALLEGLQVHGLPETARNSAMKAHLQPRPRFDILRFVLEVTRPTALIDVSDGLGLDLSRLCEASGCGCRVDLGRIPMAAAARAVDEARGNSPGTLALGGGEDFELLMTVPEKDAGRLERGATERGVEFRSIGVVTEKMADKRLVHDDGTEVDWPSTGFDHFRPKAAR